MDPPETLVACLREAGFAHVSVHRDPATFPYATPEDWWQERWALVSRLPLERLAPAELAEVRAKALAHARELHRRRELVAATTALYTLGDKPVTVSER